MDSRDVSFNTKLAYSVGQTAEGLKNAALGMFVLFYYNQVLGLSASLAGLALFIALLFDAVTDPVAGSLSDNWQSRFGRRHPFMYASALPLALMFYLLFVPPEGLEQWGLFAWLTVFIVLTRGAMTLYHVPHIALGAELSDDYEERTRIVAMRYFLSFVGWLLAYYLGFGLFFADSEEFPRGQFNVEAYGPFALVVGVLMFVTIIWSGVGTHHRIPYLPVNPASTTPMSLGRVFTRTLTETIEALRNRNFFWAFSGTLVIFVMVGVDSGLNLYMFEFFWELSSGDKLMLMLLYPLGIMSGTLLTPYLHRYVDKRHGMTIGITGWSVCQILPIFLRFFGYFPENGTDELAVTLTAIKFVQGIAAAQSLVSFNSMVADIADEHELQHGKRQEGIFFAAGSFASKATSGLGTLMAGVALDIINWPTGDHIRTADDVPVETLANLALTYGPIVSGFAVISVLCVLQCTMTRQQHEHTTQELLRRRAQSDEAGEVA